jgi:subfamily B ATP-binding cassette protein MsbA
MGGGGLPRGERARGSRRTLETPQTGGLGAEADKKKKKRSTSAAWKETQALIAARRGRLGLGLCLMLINRASGLVLPATSKYLIDDVIGQGRVELLKPLAFAAGLATLVQAITSFSLSQVLGVAAQRAITDMRRRVEAHVARLPVRYFDSTQSGTLVSRVMNDAEGIRNLVGNGLVQLVGSIVTAAAALAYLFYLNWWLTLVTLGGLLAFGAGMWYAFRTIRPRVPRARKDIRRDHRTLDRDDWRHTDRQDVHGGKAGRARLHHRRPPAVPEHREDDHVHFGDHRIRHHRDRRDRRHDDRRGRPGDHRWPHDHR